jgi:tRNA pseudouridine38/39 synthase
VLFSALLKSRLVPAQPGFEPESPEAWPGDDAVEYSKCGRTDRGVSAFGQVVGVRVRSNRPVAKTMEIDGEEEEEKPWDDIADELPYTQILNRLLPPTIRILAWCPNPPEGFSARFNCRARHYRYFFTNPMLAPTNENATLDIEAMNTAASYFLGRHDFRNFCKLDPAKQIDNFEREILRSSIERLPGNESSTTATYYFDLKGTAFLWHQVRHMMAVLFLVGQGLEKPEIVRDMLDINVFPTKPMYEMADDRPLVLWDCIFPDEDMKWIVADEGDIRGALADTTWMEWHRKKIDEVLAGELVGLVQRTLESGEKAPQPNATLAKRKKRAKAGHVLVLGTGEAVLRGKFVAMKDRKRMRPVKEINESFLERKGDWRERRERKRKAAEEAGEEVE